MKTVRILDSRNSDTTHWDTCRHEQCIGYQCPRYEQCCGEVSE